MRTIVFLPGPIWQGTPSPPRVRHSAQKLTDGGGLIVIRRLWDALDLGSLIDRRGIRRLFGWVRMPDPTIFSRWLRRAGSVLVPLLVDLLWHVVQRRWAATAGVPKSLEQRQVGSVDRFEEAKDHLAG